MLYLTHCAPLHKDRALSPFFCRELSVILHRIGAIVAAVVVLPGAVFATPPPRPIPVVEQNAFENRLESALIGELASSAARFRAFRIGSTVNFPVTTHLGPAQLKLRPFDIRGKGYRAEITTGARRVVDPVQVDLFESPADPDAGIDFARLALISLPGSSPRKITGFLSAGGTYYHLTQANPGAPQITALRLSHAEMERLLQRCGVDHLAENFTISPHEDHAGALNTSALRVALPELADLTSYKELEIATDADEEYVRSLGSRSSANAEILSILSAVDAIYRAQLGIHITVTYQHAWQTPDPYSTEVVDALSDFGSYWDANFSRTIEYDLAHLFSGRSYGSTLGVAWVGSVCIAPSYRYGLSASLQGFQEYNAVVAAHEIGHNLGANHDPVESCENRYIMCPTVGATNAFSPQSIAVISSHVGSVSCLADTVGPDPNDDPDPRTEAPELSVAIRQDRIRYTIRNTATCGTVELVAAKTVSALKSRQNVTTIGTFTGSTETLIASSTGMHRYRRGNSAGYIYFDLNCDGAPVNLNRRIRASRITARRSTRSLNTILRDLKNGFVR